MVAEGILEPVEFADWASFIVAASVEEGRDQ